jgi:multiple sugar transport system substrate-binding protein
VKTKSSSATGLAIAVLIALAVASPAFCGGAQEQGAAAGPVSLTWHVEEGQMTYAPEAVESFNRLHPEIQIDLEKYPWLGSLEMMTTRFIGRQDAPIMSIHYSWVIRFAALGYLADIDPYLKDTELSDFWPDILQQFNYDGHQRGIPVFADMYGYVYNAGMYEEAGLNPEAPPKDWAELRTHLIKLNRPQQKQYGMVSYFKAGDHMGANFVNAFIRQNKGRVLSEDYKKSLLDQPAAIEATQFVADLFLKEKVIAPASMEYHHSEAGTAFAMGEGASIQTASVLAATIYTKNPDINMYSAPWPKGKQWKGPRGYGWGISVSERTEYKEQATEFIKFLVSPDNVRGFIVDKGGYLGPRISVTRSHPKLSQQPYIGLVEAMANGYSWIDPPVKAWQEIALTELDYLQEIFLGRSTTEDALNRANAAINEILKRE